MSTEEPVDVVTTVGDLDWVVVLLREFLHRSGATRAVALLEAGGAWGDSAEGALVDCGQLEPVEVVRGERTVALPHAVALDPTGPFGPVAVPEVRQLPPFEVDPEAGSIASPMGGMEHYARAVRDLAATLGGRSVAVVSFRTDRPDVPLSISARTGDPLVVVLGEAEHELEPGWPPDR